MLRELDLDVSPPLTHAPRHVCRIPTRRRPPVAPFGATDGDLGMNPPTDDEVAKTSDRTKIAVPITLAIAALAIGGTAWWVRSTRPPPPAHVDSPTTTSVAPNAIEGALLNAAQLRAQGVQTARIKEALAIPVEGLPARTVAPLAASTQVVAPYGGVVTRILVDEGAEVRQGQPMACIQSQDVLAAQANLARAQIDAAAAAAQARRDAALLDEGIIPAARSEKSEARAAAAHSTLQEARDALARVRLVGGGQAGEYELLAPSPGRVMRRYLIPGQAVAPLEIAYAVADPGALDVVFAAPLRLRSVLRPGLELRLPDGSPARVTAVGGDTDLDSQNLRVRARIDLDPAQPSRYAAGQQISVTLLLPAPPGTLSVPSPALLPIRGGHVLYIAEPAPQGAPGDMRIRAVPVQLLGQDELLSLSVVRAATSGTAARPAPVALAPGMQVVTRGTALLKPMVPVP